jgi:hypothetical protein
LDQHGRNVHIKVVKSTSEELQVTQYLNSPTIRSDNRNHTIPTISTIQAGDWTFVVQAWWGSAWMSPARNTVARLMMAHELLEVGTFSYYSSTPKV